MTRGGAQARAKGLKLDPERSVITLVALDNRRVAVHQGSTLRDRFGLGNRSSPRSSTATSSLSPATRSIPRPWPRSWPASTTVARTRQADRRGQDRSRASPRSPRPRGLTQSPQTPATNRAAPHSRPASRRTPAPGRPSQSRRSNDPEPDTLALFGSLLAGRADHGGADLAGPASHPELGRGQDQGIPKKAVDVMDTLDALKARLKPLPVEDPDFKEPMAGETPGHVRADSRRSSPGSGIGGSRSWTCSTRPRRWPRRTRRSGRAKLKEAEKLVSDSKVFEQIEAQAKACAAEHGPAQQGPRDGKVGRRRGRRRPAGDRHQGGEGQEGRAAHGPLQARDRRDRRPGRAGQGGLDARPDRGQADARQGRRSAPATLRDRVEQILERYRGRPQDLADLAQALGEQGRREHRKPGTAARRGRRQPRSPASPRRSRRWRPCGRRSTRATPRPPCEHLAGGEGAAPASAADPRRRAQGPGASAPRTSPNGFARPSGSARHSGSTRRSSRS